MTVLTSLPIVQIECGKIMYHLNNVIAINLIKSSGHQTAVSGGRGRAIQLQYFLVHQSFFNGVKVTGPVNPEGRGGQDEASNKSFLIFSFFLAGMLVL